MEKPSGPGALSGSIPQITATTSCSVKGFIRPELVLAETNEGIKDKKSSLAALSETPSSEKR